MRVRRKFAVLLSVIVLTVIMLTYLLINQSIRPSGGAKAADTYQLLETKLLALEHGFSRHSDEVAHVQRQIDSLRMADGGGAVVADESPHLNAAVDRQRDEDDVNENGAAAAAATARCSSIRTADQPAPVNTVQMLDVYGALPFDNPDGGVWKQGWRLDADAQRWSAHRRLRVIVVPHSHNDPGWLKTFDEYYEHSTRSILNNMLQQLTDHPAQTFIWAEVSYFQRWYDALTGAQQRATAELVRQRRLEFVTGGWVMADEANAHWLGLLQQLTEGQSWLRRRLNVTPTASWSIDPFGQSATMPLLLRAAGQRDLLVQRAHYAVKRRLAQERQLEFRWRQVWDADGGTELFTHMMPFYSYDVPHTCGPEPRVCCQFDFKRLPGYGLSCPWNVAPQVIDEGNVAQRAELLLDQWRKKATLYRGATVLVPLGDDFRYTQTSEWEAQRANYQRLFEYMNNEPALHVEAGFGTLGEYFEAVHREQGPEAFPTLSGDFFTYADRDDHYWSGYYTSRPYHKRLDRVLMAYLRSAEMLHAWSEWPAAAAAGAADLAGRLQRARRALALFQHHDGVTGTAKDHVMRDYARRMNEAVADCKHVMQQAVYRHLTERSVYEPDPAFTYFHVDDSRSSPAAENGGDDSAAAAAVADQRPTIILGAELPTKYVVVHNGLPQRRDELVEVLVSKPTVRVTDAQQQPVAAQVAPVWSWHRDAAGVQAPAVSTTKYRLVFRALVAPLGLRTYVVHSTGTVDEALAAGTTYARCEVYAGQPLAAAAVQLAAAYPHRVRVEAGGREVSLRVDDGPAAAFTVHGTLKSITPAPDGGAGAAAAEPFPVHLSFVRYGARRGQERSGAYLFLPDGPAQPLPLGAAEPTVVVERGELESRCTSGLPFARHETILRAAARDGSGAGAALEVRNLVDIRGMDNVEVAMRLQTAIRSADVFYTDLNGMQLLKRRRFQKLPLQANYYPVPTQLFVEDAAWRLSVLTGQPLGGSSLAAGQLEIMQDRRLTFDDNRGLGQGVLDNRPVLNLFRVLLEPVAGCRAAHGTQAAGAMTGTAHAELQTLLHPVEKLIWYETAWAGVRGAFGEEREPLEAGLQVAVLRSLEHVGGRPPPPPVAKGKKRTVPAKGTAVGVVVHRTQLRACKSDAHRTGAFNLRRTFGVADVRPIHASRITLLQRDAELSGTGDIDMCPMDIKAFIISR